MKLGEALSLAIDRGQFHGPGNDRRAAGGSKLLRTVGGERKGSRSGRRVRIVISEREPLRFLEILAAALREGHHVFLANPDWKETEWRSAEEQVRPDAIWKDGKLTLVEKEEKEIDFREGEDVYVGVPTGGTGGRIRFALHTESTFTAAVDGFRRFFGVERIDSTCLLPLFHVSGLMQVMRALFTGGAVRFAPLPFRPGDALPFPADENSAFVSLVPTQLRRFLDSASSLEILSRFHAILVGGAPAGPQLLNAGRQAGLRLAPTYGMTETAAAICAVRPEAFLAGGASDGELLPHARIRVLTREGGVSSPGKEGRLFIESPALFKGYFPHAAPSLQEWESGDIGCMGEDGTLRVIGRLRPTINSGGEKIDPEEVERALLASGCVEEVHVMGVPHEEWGEAVAAAFVPVGDADAPELKRILRCHLAPYKIPKVWVRLSGLPRNAQGKPDRAEIEKQLCKADELK